MGANAQTTVPTFTAGQVLTADQQNQSARTGVPVFATTVERDAAFGGTGEKTLAEGQLCYLESTNVVQYYDGSSWATVGPQTLTSGLTLISSTTIGSAVSTVTVTGAFSATYNAYKVILSGGTGSVVDENLTLVLGATTTGYYAAYTGVTYSTAAASLIADNNAASWTAAGRVQTDGLCLTVEIINPFTANKTFITGANIATPNARLFAGFLNNTTSYTAFTVAPSSGTITGGTIKVYGYQN